MSLLATIGAIGGLVGGLSQLGGSIYNAYSDQRNYDYQKNLQQKIFEREDNAHQREVEDLRLAGLSPTLSAGGSGAGAGQVVSTSAPQFNSPDIDFLRKAQEYQGVKNMQLQNDQAKEDLKQQKELFDVKKSNQSLQNTLLLAEIAKSKAQYDYIMSNIENKGLINENLSYKNKNLERDFWLDLIFRSIGSFSNVVRAF